MSITYNIYSNGSDGGPVNYATPLANIAGLSYLTAALAPGSDTTFAVRALDTANNLEEANTDARVRIVLDANGQDISSRPNAPQSLTAAATAGGGCLVSWAYNTAGQGGAPTGFSVYLTAGSAVNYSTPAASVNYVNGQVGYSCTLSGLADGTTYCIGVRSFNAVAQEPNTTVVVTVTGDATPPNNVDSLTAVVI